VETVVEMHPLFVGLPLGKIYGEWAVKS